MSRPSQSLAAKLSNGLSKIQSIGASSDLDIMLSLASNTTGRFNSVQELRRHLTEGALLNINVLASKALSIPSGNYVVWSTNSGNTVLMPIGSRNGSDVVTRESPNYELHTQRLLGSWNRLARVIAEAAPDEHEMQSQKDHYQDAPEVQPEGPYTFGSKVSRVDLWQAMKDRGIGTTELATAVGVDKSTISRLLRRVKTGKEEPGGRNPSAEVAMKIARILGVPVDIVMPPESELLGKKRSGTTGSGKTGTSSWSRTGHNLQGPPSATQESRQRKSDAMMEQSLIYHAAKLLAELRIDPVEYIKENVSDRMLVLEFLGGIKKLFGGGGNSFDKAIVALKDLAKKYGDRNYNVRIGKGGDRFSLVNFLSNVIKNLTSIKDNMPDMEKRQAGVAQQAGEKKSAQANQAFALKQKIAKTGEFKAYMQRLIDKRGFSPEKAKEEALAYMAKRLEHGQKQAQPAVAGV